MHLIISVSFHIELSKPCISFGELTLKHKYLCIYKASRLSLFHSAIDLCNVRVHLVAHSDIDINIHIQMRRRVLVSISTTWFARACMQYICILPIVILLVTVRGLVCQACLDLADRKDLCNIVILDCFIREMKE